MIILGLNINHADSSACIIVDGKIVAAIEEERFVRIKHYSGFPFNSIKFCLETSSLNLNEVNFVTLNCSPSSNLKEKFSYSVKNILSISTLKKILSFKKKLFHSNELNNFLNKNNFNGKVINVEHHTSHMASSYYNSKFDNAVGLTIDGFGDFCSTESFLCKSNKIQSIKKVYFPHSLGILYQSITQFLGFKNYGDEYKVMGLASYGNPVFLNEFENLIHYNNNSYFSLNLDYFSHHTNPEFTYNFPDGIPKFPNLYSEKMMQLFGEERRPGDKIEKKHFDIASSLQKCFEHVVFSILNKLYSDTNTENLCLAGGCALNSKLNGLIRDKTPFKNIFIQPNAGDAGGAMGSALNFLKQNKSIKNSSFKNELNKCYLGSEYTNDFIEEHLIKKNSLVKNYTFQKLSDTDLYIDIAKRISNNQVIGWFKGRCEWGPRALGNRSILADARNPEIKDILNKKIKLRETFRPFAPAVLEEFSDIYFDLNYPSPFMLNVVNAKKLAKDKVPSVVHVDNTCRVQTVNKNNNYHFYNLIAEFDKITGVPILLNTSFNENEPIVLTPEHAFNCFNRTSMDCLVLENWVISR
jgi:carbamoyltransferase